MYEEIINEIKANLGENKELNKKYLSNQINVYKDHEYNKEIIKEISRMMWDCLSEEEKNEYKKITEDESPILDILNDISYDIERTDYKIALDKLDKFMDNFLPLFEDDKINEYHFFTNPLEEILFNRYIGSKKEVRHIPDNQPLLDLYYIYGFLLLETNQLEKSEKYLKKAMKINPVSARIILELCEIYKKHTYNYNKFYMFTTDALKYSYLPLDIARCYRNLGYYYIAENQPKTALALFMHSMNYDMSPLAYSEINYIKSKNGIDLTLEESIEIIKSKNIPTEVNPFILETLHTLAQEYEENLLFEQSSYFYKLIYGITKDEKTLEKINELSKK